MYFKSSSGFALPTIMIASMVMIMVLLSAVQVTIVTRSMLNTQYYDKLNSQATESGQVMAQVCLEKNNYVPQWTDAAPLKPNTNCAGVELFSCPANSTDERCYVLQSGNIKTTFSVPLPVVGTGQYTKVSVNSSTNLTKTSDNLPWRTYSDTSFSSGRYSNPPQLSGGAGWLDTGHIGFVASSTGVLYGFGANVNGQITDSKSPTSILTPAVMALPAGVETVKKIASSGQGASFICIIGSDFEAYCRGDGLNLTSAWSKVGLAANLNAYDLSLDGYGDDAACVLAGTSTSDMQSYCFGRNDYGLIGNGSATAAYPIDSPQKFILPVGQTAKKIMVQNNMNCAITNLDDLYCAGLNAQGQITGTSASSYSTPNKYKLPNMGLVARKAKDVLMEYHGGENAVHVLATDGTIWSSGSYFEGDFGNSTTSGSTGYTGVPSWFGNDAYGKGGAIQVASMPNLCIDNYNNSGTDGNKVGVYDCNGTGAQRWFVTEQGVIFNPSTGKCLDLPGNDSTDSNDLEIWTCNGTPAQTWNVNENGRIQHVQSGKCVDVEGYYLTSGSDIQIYYCDTLGYPTQTWQRTAETNAWKGMISGPDFFCGLREDGYWSGAWCSGQNGYGQLANVSSTGSHGGQCVTTSGMWNVNIGVDSDNEQVDISKLSSEWQYQYDSLLLITKSGKIFGSGRNLYGKLGNGALGDSANNYRQCVTVEFDLPDGVKAVDMSTRDEYTTYVLGNNGRVYSAGRNNLGQAGNGSTGNVLTPGLVKLPRVDMMY